MYKKVLQFLFELSVRGLLILILNKLNFTKCIFVQKLYEESFFKSCIIHKHL
jgi:hypothetical protein